MRDLKPNCKQCEERPEMKRLDGLFALTRVEKNKESEGVTFMPASGIPVIVFVCPNCGEISLYPAKLFGEI